MYLSAKHASSTAVENLPFQFLQQFVENLQSFENKTHTNDSYSVNLLHASCHREPRI